MSFEQAGVFDRIALLAVLSILSGCIDSGDDSGGTAVEPPVDPPPPPGNSAPSISGMAATAVLVGQTYSFTPTASDPDGDSLIFSIDTRPVWANFDSSTGNLSGVPALAHIGAYDDIIISVSDGSLNASLAPFSISVSSNPPTSDEYIGFGSVTQGADSCPATLTTYRVTSLSGGGGAGTLRDAVSEDCRHVVFDVGGDINLGDLQISRSYLTIDGSTAPAPGITLTNVGRLVLEAAGGQPVHDVIVNNIRAIGQGGSIESNDLWELDGSSGAPIYNVILDHLTMENSGDGNVDIYGDVHDITLSNSLIMNSIQGQHYSQSSGLRERITVFGNVYAKLNERQPRIRYNTRQLDFVGNVVYGWGWFEGGATGMNIDVGTGTPSANVEQNTYYYVAGLNGGPDDALVINDIKGSWFFSNNVWPAGETQGDTASTSGRVSLIYQGVDYAVPRRAAEILAAGTHFPTADESALLGTIDDAVANGSAVMAAPPPSQSAYRGIPEPSNVLGFDVWATYTADQQVSGAKGNVSLSCTGTASAPCLIDVSSATFTGLSLAGSYAILQGGHVNAPASSGPFVFLNNCNNCVVRDLELAGPKADSGDSSAVVMNDNSVWIRGSIHGFGDSRSTAREQGFHGMKIMSTNVWVLDAEIYDVSGDSIQVGDAGRGAGNNVYIGGGYFHDNRGNGVEIRNGSNSVVSGVLMNGFRPNESDPGSAMIVNDDAVDSKIYDNIISDSTIGIASLGRVGHIIDNNHVQALKIGIQLRNTSNIVVTNNTIDASIPIEVQGGVTGNVQIQ